MNRRKILQLTGATFTTAVGATSTVHGQEDEGEGENGEPSDGTCVPELQMGDQALIIDDTGYSDDPWASVEVINTGHAPSGEIELTVEWLDDAGNFVEEDWTRLHSLAPGETWTAYVQSLLEPDEIDDFRIIGEYEVGQPHPPHDMTITESELTVDEFGGQISGVVENTRETDLEYVSVLGTVYDGDGTVLGGGSDIESDLSAGSNWSFEISTPRLPYQAPEPADHVAMLDSRTYLIQG